MNAKKPRIGIVQMLDSLFGIDGLGDFFDAIDCEWRYLYWPAHLSVPGMEDVFVKKTGISMHAFDLNSIGHYVDFDEIRIIDDKEGGSCMILLR